MQKDLPTVEAVYWLSLLRYLNPKPQLEFIHNQFNMGACASYVCVSCGKENDRLFKWRSSKKSVEYDAKQGIRTTTEGLVRVNVQS